MTAIIRENAYAPLFALLQTVPGIVTSNRKVQLLEKMSDGTLPALFMSAFDQETVRGSKMPKHRLAAHVFLYAKNPTQEISADMALNGLLDALEAVLEPSPGLEMQTLGGAVSHCWIEGKTEIFAGPLGVRAAAIVPVLMDFP